MATKTYIPTTFYLLLIVIFSLLITFNAHGKDETQQLFSTPIQLTSAAMLDRDDALTLLTQSKFHQQILQLAKGLSADVINQQGSFNKMALLSILGQHQRLLQEVKALKNGITFSHYSLRSEAILAQIQDDERSLEEVLTGSFKHAISEMDDEALFQLHGALGWSVEMAQDYAFNIFKQYKDLTRLDVDQAINLIVNIHLYQVLRDVIPTTRTLLQTENNKRYHIQPARLIKTQSGIELTATIVTNKRFTTKRPSALQFTIYADETAHIKTAIHAAAHGYVGIVVNTRGKRLSPHKIIPWEHDGHDATQAIQWITQQPWSSGEVVMYGGSYNGFTQWAAAKHMHPALKAIAPYTAASLITGLPYENNIVLTGNYAWPFYVTNNKDLDNSQYSDWQKTQQLVASFYESGLAIKDIEKLDGRENPWFQKWLQHPSFDRYYQNMVPYRSDYANINIPVLTVTGYFDGGQISALDYLKRHYRYNPNADHTLLIGPYNHGTAQTIPRSHHSNYKLDEVALEKDTDEIVFKWFDHVLFDQPKPRLLKDKVNYQLMGSNQWRHEQSFTKLNHHSSTYYLGTTPDKNDYYPLLTEPEKKLNYQSQLVDMADRSEQRNQAPWPVIQDQITTQNGLVYMTPPFDETKELVGTITGNFSISVNKKDVDIGYNFYEIDPNGVVFHLNNYRSRASHARSMEKRQLLVPHKKTIVPIVNARMTAKLIEKGSRLALVLNVNKNQDAQVNFGSGKQVNSETADDAGENLHLKWFNDSEINLPLRPVAQ